MKRLAILLLLGAGCPGPDDDGDGVTPQWETAFGAEDFGWLLSAWGPEPDTVFAVGGEPTAGRINRFDGTAWSELSLPADTPLINWVYGFGTDDVTFVGAGGTVLHYDGNDFLRQTTPTEEDLWGVWGAAPNDLWAVGGRGREDNQATILHYDGVEWTKSSTPTLSRPNVFAYFKVWGTSSNNVYAVGQRGAIARWDGSTWSEVESGTAEDLVSLWGSGPDNIVAVGGRSNGVAVTYDGSNWTSTSLAPLPGLNGVWMAEQGGAAYIGGVQGTAATFDAESKAYEVEDAMTFLTIHAMFGIADRLYAVGGTLQSLDPPYRGVAVTRSIE